MKSRMGPLFTKTVLGSVVAVFGYLSQPDVLAVLPKRVAAVVTAVGIIVSVLGARSAIAKNGTGA